tara:strand:- start:250 stop:414 length:165 start_codon:yes stop_codon:yes gene_type:complete
MNIHGVTDIEIELSEAVGESGSFARDITIKTSDGEELRFTLFGEGAKALELKGL